MEQFCLKSAELTDSEVFQIIGLVLRKLLSKCYLTNSRKLFENDIWHETAAIEELLEILFIYYHKVSIL